MIDKLLADGCGCKMNCTNKLGREAIEEGRGNCAKLSKQDLDVSILGQLAAFDHQGQAVCGFNIEHEERSTLRE